MDIHVLPAELVLKIFGFLDGRSLAVVSMSSKKLNRIATDWLLWQALCSLKGYRQDSLIQEVEYSGMLI
jgi:hypothetical protein